MKIAASSRAAAASEWFTAAELASLALPGLPSNKRSINRRAQEERWASRESADGELLVRRRAGRGGGAEFHASLLPGDARLELARRGIVAADAPQAAPSAQESAWAWYDAQRASVKRDAEKRLCAVDAVHILIEAGLSKTAAIADVSQDQAIGKATLWNWMKLVDGIARADWLPALAPRRQGGGVAAAIDPLLWQAFKSDYLRNSAPTLTSVYERVAAIAAQKNLSMPSERTFRRRLDKEVSAEIITLKREGEEAMRRSIPANRRSVADLGALEWVNIDGHKFDVFVQPPHWLRQARPIRPILVAIQDVYSRKILAWRLGVGETALQTRLAFADVFREWGIPHHALLDNSRAFWSKWITGGHRGTRFRFKVKEDEPVGLLIGVGIKVHAAKPYHGQSKPIERAFKDFGDRIAKHPEFEGAYTGNSPMAKPENYGSKAVAWDVFCKVVDEQIRRHNARPGRRTEMARGRSFDDVFAESYTRARISKVTNDHLRLALLAGAQKKLNSLNGEIELYGNRYWHPPLTELRGEKVTVRFDPDDLHSDIHVYDLEGRYLTKAPLLADTGFADAAGAKIAAKREADHRRLVKAKAEAEELISMEELALLQAGVAPADKPAPRVVRPVRHADADAQKSSKATAIEQPSVIDRMRIGRAKLKAANN